MNQNSVSVIEKRRYKRMPISHRTTAVFNDDKQIVDSVHVMNISEAGMLMCDYCPEIRFPVDTKLYDIFVKIPSKAVSDGSNSEEIVPLLISQAVVVRSSVEEITNRTFYGISFTYCNPSIQDKIRDLVDKTC